VAVAICKQVLGGPLRQRRQRLAAADVDHLRGPAPTNPARRGCVTCQPAPTNPARRGCVTCQPAPTNPARRGCTAPQAEAQPAAGRHAADDAGAGAVPWCRGGARAHVLGAGCSRRAAVCAAVASSVAAVGHGTARPAHGGCSTTSAGGGEGRTSSCRPCSTRTRASMLGMSAWLGKTSSAATTGGGGAVS
jgi:hypothetical protein